MDSATVEDDVVVNESRVSSQDDFGTLNHNSVANPSIRPPRLTQEGRTSPFANDNSYEGDESKVSNKIPVKTISMDSPPNY